MVIHLVTSSDALQNRGEGQGASLALPHMTDKNARRCLCGLANKRSGTRLSKTSLFLAHPEVHALECEPTSQQSSIQSATTRPKQSPSGNQQHTPKRTKNIPSKPSNCRFPLSNKNKPLPLQLFPIVFPSALSITLKLWGIMSPEKPGTCAIPHFCSTKS